LLKLLKRSAIYSEKTVLLAFEFGLVLSDVANENKIELTKEISHRAEDVLIQELRDKGFKKTALNFIPLILATLEIEEQKETP